MATDDDERQAIISLLHRQQAAWNRGDLQGFMEGYWDSDSLMFIGSSGVTFGYHQTLANYRQGYPDVAAMGQLQFSLIRIELLGEASAYVVGNWHLARDPSIGNAAGHFLLVLAKQAGHWVVVADHSS